MVILRVVLHLRLLMATTPPPGSTVSIGISALAMVIILTVVVGTVMLAIATRRMATGRRDCGPPAGPSIGRARTARERPVDAWSEAGRRMPVPPREEDEVQP